MFYLMTFVNIRLYAIVSKPFLHRETPKIFLISRVTPTYENAYGPEKVGTGSTILLRLTY
jgi:hypothetical protein